MAAKANTVALFPNTSIYRELYHWLKCKNIAVDKLESDFSDGVEFASLLERVYPKSVDISLYLKQKTFEGRVYNWRMLNSKSLIKLGLPLDNIFIKKLALGTTETIQTLLIQLMETLKAEEPLDVRDDILVHLDQGDVFVAKVPMLVGNTKIRVKRKMIKGELYEKLLKEIDAKKVYLNALLDDVEVLRNKLKTLSPPCERNLKKIEHMINKFKSMSAGDTVESEANQESDLEECYQESPQDVRIKRDQPTKQVNSAKLRSNSVKGKKRARVFKVKSSNSAPRKGITKNTEVAVKQEMQRKNTRTHIPKCAKDCKRKRLANDGVKPTGTKSAVDINRPLVENRKIRCASISNIRREETLKRWKY